MERDCLTCGSKIIFTNRTPSNKKYCSDSCRIKRPITEEQKQKRLQAQKIYDYKNRI